MSPTSGKRKSRRRARNLLDMVPVRNPAYQFVIHSPAHGGEKRAVPAMPDETLSDSDKAVSGGEPLITIPVPRFRGNVGQKFGRLFHVRPFINLRLDAYGSLVLLNCDGKKTVREIGVELKRRFGEKVEPLYGRLGDFLGILEANRLLSFLPAQFDRRPEQPRKKKAKPAKKRP